MLVMARLATDHHVPSHFGIALANIFIHTLRYLSLEQRTGHVNQGGLGTKTMENNELSTRNNPHK